MTTNNSNSGFAIHPIFGVLTTFAQEQVILSNGLIIPKGYLRATDLTQSASIETGKRKEFGKYFKSTAAQEYLEALAEDLGYVIENKTNTPYGAMAQSQGLQALIIVNKGGNNLDETGIFIHPLAAKHYAMWVSAKFAVAAIKVIDAVINNDFKALTPEAEKAQKQLQTIWEELRLAGIIKRNFFTDAIKVYLENNDVSVDYIRWIYPNCSDAVNKALFGKSAKKLCEERNCDRNHLRDTHSSKDLDRIATIEKHAEKLILKFNTEPLQAIKEAIAFYED